LELGLDSQKIVGLGFATSLAFSPDHTYHALCDRKWIVFQNPNSEDVVVESNTTNEINHCCFSSDDKFIAAAVGENIYVWSIDRPHCHLIDTFVGHTDSILGLAFSSPSSLISVSKDGAIRFWQIGALSKNWTATDLKSTPHTLSSILSVSLQARAGVAISSEKTGVVKTWDLLTGNCKTSVKTPAGDCDWRDARVIDGRLITVWYQHSKIYIWDTSKDKLQQVVSAVIFDPKGLRISGDGSKVFCLTETAIQVWSMDTGKHMGNVRLELGREWHLDPLQTDGSRIWVQLKDLSTQGWDLGTSSSSLVPSSVGSTGRPLLDFIGGSSWQTEKLSWIKDMISGKEIFQLSGRHARPREVQWDGQYLVAGYDSGELLILDFNHMYPQ
jgi:WD40 repeat protein